MIIAGFDLATQSAVAYGRPNTIPVVEVVRAPASGDNLGVFGSFYWRWFNRLLDRLTERLEPGEELRIAFEAPILPQKRWDAEKKKWVGGTTIQTTRRLHSLGVLLETACEDHPTKPMIRECSLKSMKVQLTGNGNASKPDMVQAARRAGVVLPEGDEAFDGADGFAAFLTGVRYWAPEHYEFWLKRVHGRSVGQERMSAAEARRLL